MRNVLFKVIRRSDRHEYIIYDNGEIEGFESDSVVVNYYPALVRAECTKRIDRQQEEQLSPAKGANT